MFCISLKSILINLICLLSGKCIWNVEKKNNKKKKVGNKNENRKEALDSTKANPEQQTELHSNNKIRKQPLKLIEILKNKFQFTERTKKEAK